MSKGVLVVFFFLLSALAPSEAALCTAATGQCGLDATCAQLLVTYSANCALAIAGGGECSAACKDAYAKLIANAIGQQLNGCDCGGLSTCVIPQCVGNGDNPPDDTTTKPVTKPVCSDVRAECTADQTCAAILLAQGAVCASVENARGTCNQTCKDSYYALSGNAIGKKFYDCTCTTGDTCTKRKNLADSCFSGSLPAPSSGIGNVANMLVVLTCAIVGSLVLIAQ